MTRLTKRRIKITQELPITPERAAFERFVSEWTGRDMVYHVTYGTTGLDFAWEAWQAGMAAERHRSEEKMEWQSGTILRSKASKGD